MNIVSNNPYTNKEVFTIKALNLVEIEEKLAKAQKTYQSWRKTSLQERSMHLLNVAKELKTNNKEYAETMTAEMGKPISQSIAEIDKCAWVCEYYAKNAPEHLANKVIETEASKSYVRYESLGVVLAIMPWNYPFWQVFRFIAPALMAGNIGVLKHASNVMKSAENIEKVFDRAGLPKGCFQNMAIGSERVENIIKDDRIKAVTLTGSKPAGSSVASIAASVIKKSVLELGGSNALVVFSDCDIDKTVETCVQARFQNTGQSCIAGKRLLVHDNIYEEFVSAFAKAVSQLKSGDPMDLETYIGVMAREDLAKELDKQLKKSVDKGAKVILGGHRQDAYFEPTIVTEVTPEMSLFKEETFGPVIGITSFTTDQEAVDLVNQSDFGLGVSIFTTNEDRIETLIPQFEDGAVFVNDMVKSNPNLPFGGTKISGYGRELSMDGIQEFVNKKTVYIK
ncbi:NAD-dependent succinate-semialdehyde dehydrogenase [Dokdonia sp. Hel_I_53]|uniref:NAD-dependent succinate-semialdehyde dehydrogenase n=1 Tax=Dokdonia sp. Hel_I_53 TaxID=1566287 RepID=UPI00119918C0|nr:NAD-dependent succinate-semialdehyde dehydrogenase [Dokdonia sp. Hel_I_53]TVZ51613.1 succinate-semialdehyde dehydrogenase/glutarate-semialdehyde dehydrogenase [Dokdonia sp. Hel_I_53]